AVGRGGRASVAGERAPVEDLFGGTLSPGFNLGPLFAGMAAGRDEGWLTEKSLRVRFVGRLTERAEAEAERWGLSQYVEASAVIPRGELLAELVNADALLLPLYDEDPYSLPMRFFDYVGAG